jgi:hypothetical protein
MVLLLVALALTSANTDLLSPLDNAKLEKYLFATADWIMTTDVGSNVLNNKTYFPTCNDSIFINGNLARVLLASHKIQANTSWLNEGLKWCDSFVDVQIPVVASASPGPSGCWNTGYNQVYIADTGTAVTTLALCHRMQSDKSKQARYKNALQSFANFVRFGCDKPPSIGSAKVAGVCPPKGKGWVNSDGSLGDGWYKDMLNSASYTISTGTLGACGFAEMDAILSDDALGTVAKGAANWLVQNRTADGRIPYIISPPETKSVTYQPIAYSAEGFIAVDLRFPSAQASLAPLVSTCQWLANNQSTDGSWGKFMPGVNHDPGHLGFTPSGDAYRSPRALSMLQWCASRIPALPTKTKKQFESSITKYVGFLLNETNSKDFGVNTLALPTGFVALAVADLIQPWVTFVV